MEHAAVTQDTPFEAWGLLELFGHQRLAGRLSEQTIGGCHFSWRFSAPRTRPCYVRPTGRSRTLSAFGAASVDLH